ncbi:DNA mismatch repair protein msh6, partial [Perkinsus olseni]
MSNRRSSAASDGGKRQSSLLSFFKVLPKKEEDKPSSSLHCNATDVEMVALPATVERRSSLVSEELTQVQAKSQPVGRRKRRLTYVDDNSDDDSDDHESGDAIVVPVKRPRGAHYESANSASALDVESYHELTYDTEASPAVPDVLRPRPENTVTLALRRPLESPSGDDYEVTREEIEAKARGWPPYAAACLRAYYETRDTYSYPSWMHPDKLADAKGRRPDHPDYDQSTMRVPDLRDSASRKKEEGHCTPMLLQYWEVKAKHFDEITLFKVGKFYEIFYYDAVFAQAACNLRWMGNNKKPH